MLRVARESYGPLNPVPRARDEDPRPWSRFDTPGRTIYATADRVTAYMELLAPYRTEISTKRRALQPIADELDMSLEELWEDIVRDWDEQGMMKARWLPRVFREGRALYTLELPAGWWINIAATETIAALHDLAESPWPTEHGPLTEPLTLSHLTSDDRVLTTAIAEFLRESITLQDGTLPLGVQFTSKHGHPTSGTGTCWAYWMRDLDSGLDDPTKVLHTEALRADDPGLVTVQKLCRIQLR